MSVDKTMRAISRADVMPDNPIHTLAYYDAELHLN